MQFQNLDRIVFAGDSITDMDRLRPLGEGSGDRLGASYVQIIDHLLTSCYPEICVRITNAGIGGDTSRDLLARWEKDVLDLKPDYVSICIGVNDVWRQLDSVAIPEKTVLPGEYEQNLVKMIMSARSQVKKVFLIAPFYMESSREDPFRAMIDRYAAIASKVARDLECEFVDVQSAFDQFLKYRYPTYISADRVHPNMTGATIIAKKFLEHCGFDYNHTPC